MLKLPIKLGKEVWGIMDGKPYQWTWTGGEADMEDYKFLGLYKTKKDVSSAIKKIRLFVHKK